MLVDLMKSERASNAQGKSALVSPASAACQLNEVKRVLLTAFGSASRTSERLRTGLRRGALEVYVVRRSSGCPLQGPLLLWIPTHSPEAPSEADLQGKLKEMKKALGDSTSIGPSCCVASW